MTSPATLVIDGGGTSTGVAVLRSGSITSRTLLQSFKPRATSGQTDDLCRSLGTWLASLGADTLVPKFVLIGMAGLWGEAERQLYLNEFSDSWMTYIGSDLPRVSVLSDIELVQLAAYKDLPGTVLIAGTGSIAITRTSDNQNLRCGGWGPRVDDAGGGFWFGHRALRSVAMMLDGRGPSTKLIRPVALFLRVDSDDHRAVAGALRAASVDRSSSIAHAVLTYADEGDEVAVAIRATAAVELVSLVTSITIDTMTITLHGSLFKNESFRGLVTTLIHEKLPSSEVRWMDDVLEGTATALREAG